MKKIFLTLIIIIIGGFFLFFVLNTNDYDKEIFVVPEIVSLNLRTAYGENDTPMLELQVLAGTGCDEVSNLEISKTLIKGTMFVYVEGYSIKKHIGDGGCPDAVKEARAQIQIEEFLQSGGHQVSFSLNDKDSRYNLLQDEYAIYLEPSDVTNVISHESGINQSQKPQSLALVFQNDKFASLSFNGTYRDLDYRDQLREFAKSKGLIPVDEVYKGFVQKNNDNLFVLADDLQIPNSIPSIIGEITYDAGVYGTETVDVVIKRVLSPNSYSY